MDFKTNSFEILNVLSCPIIVIDRDYHIIGANNSACYLFCFTAEDIVGHKCFEVTHSFDKPCWQLGELSCPAKSAFALKERTMVIHKHTHRAGAVFEQIIATPIFDDQGKNNFVVEEMNDITEHVKSKETIERLKKKTNNLGGLLPVCSSCKKIRDKEGHWNQIESYISNHSEANFSHGLCEKCVEELYGEEAWFKATKEKVKE